MAKIYCAGPLFNSAERSEMRVIAGLLEQAGHETFLPQRDGLELAKLESILASAAEAAEATAIVHRAIFSLDMFRLLAWSDGVVANFNGRVPDDGTIVEVSLAWHSGKALVVYKNDARAAFNGQDNPMLTGLARHQFVDDMSRICSALAAELAAGRARRVESTLATGASIAESLQQARDPRQMAALLLEWTRKDPWLIPGTNTSSTQD